MARVSVWSLLSALMVLVLGVLVVVPLAWLVVFSLRTSGGGGGLTLANYVRALTDRSFVLPAWRSLQLGIYVMLLAAVMGIPMAWATARTDMPARGLVRILAFGALIMPNFLGTIAWILLTSPKAGYINRLFERLFGWEKGPFNIYSLGGLAWVIALYTFPYFFVFTANALNAVSAEMEDAANVLGAGTWVTALKVTVPLALPAILGAAILVFLESIALFGPPSVIMIPARLPVITTQIYSYFSSYPPRVEVAAAFAMPLLLVTVVLMYLQRRLLGARSYATILGKAGTRRRIRLGRWRWVLLVYCLLVAACALFAPFLVLLLASLSKIWSNPFGGGFTFENFVHVFGLYQQPVLNTFVYAGVAATIAALVALAIGYLYNRRPSLWSRLLAFLSNAPVVVPGLVLAVGFFAAYARRPLLLYGTAWILIFAYAARFLPIAFNNTDSNLKSVHPELEEAARILGAGELTTVARITVPLVRSGLVSGWLLAFIPAMQEMSATMLLFSGHTKVISVSFFDLAEEARYEHLSALGVLLLLVILVLVVVAQRWLSRDFALMKE